MSGRVLAASADPHASLVDGVVMPRAQENHVVQIGSAAVLPFVDMVRFASAGVDAAAGGGAVLVADLERSAQSSWCGAVGASDVEHLAPAVPDDVSEPGPIRDPAAVGGAGGAGDDSGEVGVAEDPRHGCGREEVLADPGKAQGATDAVGQVVDVDGEGHVGALGVLRAQQCTVEAAVGEVG
jgi:hypothetical protein